MALDPIIIRLEGQNQSANTAIDETSGKLVRLGNESKATAVEAQKVDSALSKITGKSFDAASKAAAFLKDNLDGVRNAGVGVAALGAGGIMLTNHLAGLAEEGERATLKMEAMLRKMGESDAAIEGMNDSMGQLAFDAALPDDDPLKEAAAGLAGFGLNAEKIQGLMPGLIGQSRLYNQSLEGTSEAVGRAFAKGDLNSLARIGVVITEEQKAKLKELEDSGASMAERQAAMYDVLRSSFDKYALSITEGMSDGEIAANRQALALDNIQTAIGVGSSKAKQQLDGMGATILNIAGANPQLAEGAGYILAYGSYAAAGIGGLVAFGAQIASMLNDGKQFIEFIKGLRTAKQALTIATTASTIAAGGEAIAVTTAGGASAAAGGMAATGAAGFGALAATIGLATVAIAGFIAAYLGYKDAQTMSDDELRKKWGPLADVWIGLSGSDQANAETGDDMTGYLKGQAPKTAEEKQEDMQAKIDAAMSNIGQAAPVSIPATPSITVLPATAIAPISASSASGSSVTSSDSEKDPYADQLVSLQRQKRDLKGKENAAARDALQTQIDALQDSQRQWKEARKVAADANKKEGYQSDVDKVRAEIAANEKIDNLQSQLDAARKDKDANKVRSLTLQIEKTKAEGDLAEAQAQSAKEALTDIDKSKATLEIANLRHKDALRKAELEASQAGQSVSDSASSSAGGGGSANSAAVDDARLRQFFQRFQRGPIGGQSFGFAALNPAGTASGGGGSSRTPSIKQGPFRQNADGSYRATVEFELPYQGIGNVEVY